MVKSVKSLVTGLVHTVPDDHFSLNDPEYEVIEEKTAPVTASKAKSAPAATKKTSKSAKNES